MRKWFILISVFVFITGCASILGPSLMPHSYKVVNSKPSTVTSTTYEDIRGNFTHHTILLYKNYPALSVYSQYFGIGCIETLDNKKTYYAEVFCIYSNWLFIDTLMLRTDNGIYTLKDVNPSRKVRSDGNVEEELFIFLKPDLLEQLKTTKTLTIQYTGKPIIILSEVLSALRSFLN